LKDRWDWVGRVVSCWPEVPIERSVTELEGRKGFHKKWLGANKSAEGSQRLTSTNEKEHEYAQNEDQEQREEAFSRSSRWHRQARSSLQASHPDQEDHQEQAPFAWSSHCA